jgi:hypothetical protein
MLVAADFRIIEQPIDGTVLQLPVDAILAKTAMNIHLALLIITTENASKGAPKGRN